jgi:nucleoid-associated protein YgaU
VNRILIVGAIGVVAIVAALILNQAINWDDQEAQPAATDAVTPGAAPDTPAASAGAESADGQVAAAVSPSASVPQGGAGAPAAAPSAGTKSATGSAPSFDIVRINPRGDAVIAGRAKPNSHVTVFDAGKEIGTAVADSRGEWVLLPTQPLDPGSRELTIAAKSDNGAVATSDQAVVLVVPDRKDASGSAPASAVAVLVPKQGGGGTVLQSPTADESEGLTQNGLSLDIIDYDEKGQIVIGGRAPAAGNIQVYIDNDLVGGAVANADGRWEVRPRKLIAPGLHTLRVDQVVPPDARVVARIETPFSRAAFAEAAPGSVVVQPGNSLWRIARRTYGEGVRFSLIFEANKDQIRDPDLIYPGQVFSLPKNK